MADSVNEQQVASEGVSRSKVQDDIENDMILIVDLLTQVYASYKEKHETPKFKDLCNVYFRLLLKTKNRLDGVDIEKYWNRGLNPTYDSDTLTTMMNYYDLLNERGFLQVGYTPLDL